MDEILKQYLKNNSLRNEDNIVAYLRLMMMESQISFFDFDHPEKTAPYVKSIFEWDGWISSNSNTDDPPDYYN